MLSFSTTVYRLSASHLHLTWKQCCPILSTFRFWGLAFCMLQNQQQKIFIIWSRKPHFRCSPPSKANIRFIFNIEKDPVLVECIWVWVCIRERERDAVLLNYQFRKPNCNKVMCAQRILKISLHQFKQTLRLTAISQLK